MKSGQITIKDIARELNISPSTVSRALQDHPDISIKTKKLVNELAEKLEYKPNHLALSLRHNRTNIIGVIIPEIVHFFFSTIISGIEDVAYGAGYNVMVCQSNESFKREVTDTNALVSSRVDGLLVSLSKETNTYDHFRHPFERGVPLVFFDRVCDALPTNRVIVDDLDGAFQATQHLLDQGCKRIAHLAGPENLIIAQDRLYGYKKALEKNNVPFESDLVLHISMNSEEEGFTAAQKLLESPNPPDGIFVSNDIGAIGAMKAIKRKGLKIPEDVAVVGFSDWQISSMVEPSLTSVSQPGFEMGQAAAELFLHQIANKGQEFVPQTKVLKTKLVIRDSSLKRPVS